MNKDTANRILVHREVSKFLLPYQARWYRIKLRVTDEFSRVMFHLDPKVWDAELMLENSIAYRVGDKVGWVDGYGNPLYGTLIAWKGDYAICRMDTGYKARIYKANLTWR